jgi:DNA-binding XRE family transcriptional regulator
MITNERQYRISKAALHKFERTLLTLQSESAEDVHPILQKAYIDSTQSEIEVLRQRIKEYEDLRDGHVKAHYPDLAALNTLPRRLIQIRIASGLTQKDLATELGLKEQQIQRYEVSEYAGASLSRVYEVATALNRYKHKRRRRGHTSPKSHKIPAALSTAKRAGASTGKQQTGKQQKRRTVAA